jgi:hypothetical protein
MEREGLCSQLTRQCIACKSLDIRAGSRLVTLNSHFLTLILGVWLICVRVRLIRFRLAVIQHDIHLALHPLLILGRVLLSQGYKIIDEMLRPLGQSLATAHVY